MKTAECARLMRERLGLNSSAPQLSAAAPLLQAFLDYVEGRSPELPSGGRHVLVAAMPKSASTFLTTMIALLPGFSRVRLAPSYVEREQEIDFLHVALCHQLNWVERLHVKASEETLRIIDVCGAFPFICVRNVFDALVSLRDHMSRTNLAWVNFFPPEFQHWPADRQLDALVDVVAPWHLSFFASWDSYLRQGGAGVLVNYHDLTTDPAETLRALCLQLDIQTDPAHCAEFAQQARDRPIKFNQGISGRGLLQLSHEQVDRVHRLARYWPHVDFSPLGLGR